MLAGDAAGGVSRGGRFFVAPPLDRLLLVLFLAKQEKYITHVIDFQKVYFFTKESGADMMSAPDVILFYRSA